MNIKRNIVLTVGLIWAVIFRVYPSVAGTISSAHQSVQKTVIRDIHQANPATDSAIYIVQDEDDQQSPTLDHDFLPALPAEWQNWLLATQSLQQTPLIPVGKRATPSQPYYLLFCSLRIPSL